MLGRLRKALALNVPKLIPPPKQRAIPRPQPQPKQKTERPTPDTVALRIDVGNIHIQVVAQSSQPMFFSTGKSIYPFKNIRDEQ